MVGLVLLSASLLTAEAPNESAAVYQQHRNIVYHETDGIGLLMDIFVPTGRSNGLGIIDVISGGYSSTRGKMEDHARAKMFDTFCGRGYTVFAIRPGSVPKFTLPEMAAHVKRGIRWVKSRSEEYGIDPDRMAIVGASAGGHLACLTAMTAEPGNPEAGNKDARYGTDMAAVAVFFPPTDFLRYGHGKIERDNNWPIPAMFERYLYHDGFRSRTRDTIITDLEKLSPARLAHSNAPPFLLIHGDRDIVVPLQQSQLLTEALTSKGVACELVIKPGGGHKWPTIHEEVVVAADWIDRQLRTADTATSKATP